MDVLLWSKLLRLRRISATQLPDFDTHKKSSSRSTSSNTMAVSLGKRKRSQPTEPSDKTTQSSSPSLDSDEDTRTLQDIFRRHFEAKFKPLPLEKPHASEPVGEDQDEDVDSTDEDAEWSGFSDEEDVEVVEHSHDTFSTTAHDRHDLKAFMVRHSWYRNSTMA